jgi:hypothetical protein
MSQLKLKDAWYRAQLAIVRIFIADKILKMSEAKVDGVLANLVANRKIDQAQAEKVKAWWTENHR